MGEEQKREGVLYYLKHRKMETPRKVQKDVITRATLTRVAASK